MLPSILNDAIAEAAAHLPDRLKTSISWRSLSEADLWRELVAAVLGSHVSYEQALSALQALESKGLLDDVRFSGCDVGAVQECLRQAGYRFPRLRGDHICRNATAIYGGG